MSMLLKSLNNDTKLAIKMLNIIIFLSLNIINGFAYSNDLQVHGFIAQGVVDVDGSNYISDEEGVSFELTEIGLNASYQLTSDIRLAGQAVYLNGGNRYTEGARVDYLLLDWSLYNNENWKTKLYLGRFKNYHWLYSSTRDVPMTRPSIILPQSVYFDGTRDLSIGGDGLAIATSYSHEDIGDIDFTLSKGVSSFSNSQTSLIMGSAATGHFSHEYDFQGSIYWRPSRSQWKFGLAVTNAKFDYNRGEDDTYIDGQLLVERFYANAAYEAENWTFNIEVLQEDLTLKDLVFPNFMNNGVGQGGFVQLQYNLTPELQFLGRYEHYYTNKDDKHGRALEQNSIRGIPHYFGYQYDKTIGLKYRIAANMELQLEHHWIQGTGRLTPIILPEPEVNQEEYWQLWALQLMYWF